jgi:hypothetical protein
MKRASSPGAAERIVRLGSAPRSWGRQLQRENTMFETRNYALGGLSHQIGVRIIFAMESDSHHP